jgi:archaellum component FlaF (FlaF/FlaG flagellin family)
MKRFTTFLALVAILLSNSYIVPSADAAVAFYNITVSATSTNTVVTPTAANGKPTVVNLYNDGSVPVYVDFDRVAVAASTTAIKIGPCEARQISFDGYAGPTTLGVITDTGNTSSVRVQAHYMRSVSDPIAPPFPTSDQRVLSISNPACLSTGLSTVNGSSWQPYVDSELITLSLAALTTDSTANLLHANSLIDAVVCKQTTPITNSTNWGISDPTTANRFAAAVAIATSTLYGFDQWLPTGASRAASAIQDSAAKLRITVTVANATAGVVRCSVYGRTLVAPTS